MPASLAAAAATPTVEIWLRQRGARRQAFWRAPGRAWSSLPVPAADKALRAGRITIDAFHDAPCVPRETQPTHPAAGAFAALARSLNRDIDLLMADAGAAA